jgi:predicted Fe-Mo cluster-binding NifX family protein
MRIAVSVDDRHGLESAVSHDFGRCPFYVLADLGEHEVKNLQTVTNPFFSQHQPGRLPRFIRSHGAEVIITGYMGRRDIELFQRYGIEPVTGSVGTVARVLEKYLDGSLKGARACRESIEHARHKHKDSPHYPHEKDVLGRIREEVAALERQIEEIRGRIGRSKTGE